MKKLTKVTSGKKLGNTSVQIRLADHIAKELDSVADAAGRTRSDLIREFIDEGLRRKKAKA